MSKLQHTIYCKSGISTLGISGYVIKIFFSNTVQFFKNFFYCFFAKYPPSLLNTFAVFVGAFYHSANLQIMK